MPNLTPTSFPAAPPPPLGLLGRCCAREQPRLGRACGRRSSSSSSRRSTRRSPTPAAGAATRPRRLPPRLLARLAPPPPGAGRDVWMEDILGRPNCRAEEEEHS